MKRVFSILLILAFLLVGYPQEIQASEASKELNIYALYLESDVKGDSVLLESAGHYLLVDIGLPRHVPAVIAQLNRLGVTHVDILFSHLHNDHIGGTNADSAAGLKKIAAAGIKVDTLYLPSPTIASLSTKYPARYASIQNFMASQGSGQIVYLNVGNEFQVGDTVGQVIGPVNTSQLSPSLYTGLAEEKDRLVRYENNCSLAVLFTCGVTRYFTAGDYYKDEAAYMVEQYGESLCSDIMKLCHHGTGSGNSAELMEAVCPAYSFAPNTGLAYVDSSTNRWATYNGAHRAAKYGMCYLVGNEKQTLIYHIVNDEITLYRGSTIEGGSKLTGWQSLYGGDGVNRDHDLFYFNGKGQPVTGVKEINGHCFYFSAGGRMEYGQYDSDGAYDGWKVYEDGERYYTWSKNGTYSYLARGVTFVDDGYFYFDSEGCKVTNGTEDSRVIVRINSNDYLMDYDGELLQDTWEEQGNTWIYFDSTGKMVKNRVCQVNGKYYIFAKDGKVVVPKSNLGLCKFGSKTYAVRKDGSLIVEQCKTIQGAKYYMNEKGVVQKNKLIKIGKKNYYFGKDGKMVCNKTIKLKGKTYFCNKKGVVSKGKK